MGDGIVEPVHRDCCDGRSCYIRAHYPDAVDVCVAERMWKDNVMRIERTKEWWLALARKEPDNAIGAGGCSAEDAAIFLLRRLVFMARTTGGTAGPDKGLMDVCEEAETFLQAGGRRGRPSSAA
jgi:transposase InsO family protein